MKITLLAIIAVFSMTSCKKDEAVPDTARITGTVFIDNADLGHVKDSGDVQPSFPEFSLSSCRMGRYSRWLFWPVSPGRFALGAPSGTETIPYSPGLTQFSYTITVDPGTYSCLALGFRNNRIVDPSQNRNTGCFLGTSGFKSWHLILPYFNEPPYSVHIAEIT